MSSPPSPGTTQMSISIIACMSKHRAIGKDNQLIYHIDEDMQRFKSLTWGHTLVMGRNTFLSLPHGALPGRRNVILTHNASFQPEGCVVATHLQDAFRIDPALPSSLQEIFVIGGASVYQQVFAHCNVSNIFLTVVEDFSPTPSSLEADAFFPNFNEEEWKVTTLGEGKQGSLHYTFLHYSRS